MVRIFDLLASLSLTFKDTRETYSDHTSDKENLTVWKDRFCVSFLSMIFFWLMMLTQCHTTCKGIRNQITRDLKTLSREEKVISNSLLENLLAMSAVVQVIFLKAQKIRQVHYQLLNYEKGIWIN